jgi:HEAT repeat protein
MPHRRLLSAGTAVLIVTLVAALAPASDEEEKADEAFLREAKIGTDGPSLVAFLRSRSLSEGERQRLAALVRQLGSEEYLLRERASAALIARGPLSVPFLQNALADPDIEIAHRARRCLEEIDSGPGPALSCAAVRLLTRRPAEGAVEVLLGFAPHADDLAVEEEVHAALAAVGVRDGKADPALLTALADKDPVSRGAAAFALGRAANPAVRSEVARLCRDPEPLVRFRAALGRLAGRDRDGLDVLVALLGEAPPEVASRAEEALLRLAGDGAPAVASAAREAEAERKTWQAAWERWRRVHGDKADLARLDSPDPYLGYTLIPEMHGGRVWECDRAGRIRWQIFGLQQPREAQVLPTGRVLICEVGARRVTERDLKGNVLWTHPVEDPAYVERLPNGNTFIGTHRRAFEVTRAGKEVFSFEPSPPLFIHSMHRRPNGNVVCLSMQGLLLEVDRAGKTVRSFQIQAGGGNWCGVQGLPGNHYLAVEFNQSLIVELDAAGKVVWRQNIPGASYAVRRPDGRTLVCCFSTRRIVDVDRNGKIVWEKSVDTSPWRAHGR